MLLASWNFDKVWKGLRSFYAENLGSVGQRAAKLLTIKLWEWFDPGQSQIWADWFDQSRGRVADFFMRPPTLTASNFAALWPKDLKFSAFKDLNPFSKCVKFQEATSILRLGFALSKWPHFDSGYLLGGPFGLHLIVRTCLLCPAKSFWYSWQSPTVWWIPVDIWFSGIDIIILPTKNIKYTVRRILINSSVDFLLCKRFLASSLSL